ncbi:hypothetical protein ACW9HQ_36945 [Nocardia gipuzkoensis]
MAALLAILLALAPLAWATRRHKECASIPEDVGPCDYWGRLVWMLGTRLAWAEVVFALAVAAVLAAFVARRSRRRRSRAGVTRSCCVRRDPGPLREMSEDQRAERVSARPAHRNAD